MDMKKGAPYKIKNKVVEFEPDRLIAWRHVGLHRWRYELEPDHRRRHRGHRDLGPLALPRPCRGGAKRGCSARAPRRRIEATLVKLKAAAEADAASA